MSEIAMTLPKPSLAELLKLVVLPSKAANHERRQEIMGRANNLVNDITAIIDDLVSAAIAHHSAEEFIKARLGIFPQYFTAMRALGDLSRVFVPQQTMDRLSSEWFSELEAGFRDEGQSKFGADLADRGLFTVWILRKIHDLAQNLPESVSSDYDESADVDMALDFATKALWTRFHVDCLMKAMRDNAAIYPGIVDPIRDGLRTAVNTYACIRQWSDLRNPSSEPELNDVEWTDEDEVLLADSMRDLENEVV